MRDMAPEQQINALGLSSSNDHDYDYDVYYFAPSRSPYIVSPEDYEAFDQLEGPSLNRWMFLHDALPTRSISPVLSHSYSINSDFVFPEVEAEGGLGGLFRTGFRNMSYRLSHRLDTFWGVVQETVRVTRRKLLGLILDA
ncbi:hypothetical protein QCA50_009143 [Cerrena zonata]|uniref:Uncharacterized protein n=1 Tax=Cerrena zonata TaxID=2478898 RepID=A0AAW0GCS0_9APHY